MKKNLKIERKLFLVMAGVVLSLLVSSGVTHPQGDTTIRWDLVSLQPPNLMAGGSASALANDDSKITLTGSGTFALFDSEDVTGGGTWRTSNKDGTGTGVGTYRVVRLVSFNSAPGTLPPMLNDRIGSATDARSGLAVLRIAYSDGSRGTLVVSCHLPVGAPDSTFEGITATKGFVAFWNRQAPSDMPFIDANRTVFHVVR